MGVALFLIGLVAILAAVVMFVIALVRKRGWGIARSFVLGVVGFILVIVGTAVGIGEEMEKPGTIPPETLAPTPALPPTPAPTQATPSTPSSTADTEVGESRLNPVHFGLSLTYEDERLSVIDSKRITKISWSNPDAGNIYLIVNVRVDFLGDQSEKKHYLSMIKFRVVGSSGYIYDAEWYPETDTPLKTGEFYGGVATTGDLVYEIDEQDTNLVLIWNCGFGVDRYFEIP